MSRLEAFRALEQHPWLGRLFGKLSKAERRQCEALLEEHAGLSREAFEHLANRLFLDGAKPKNHAAMVELLICANTEAS